MKIIYFFENVKNFFKLKKASPLKIFFALIIFLFFIFPVYARGFRDKDDSQSKIKAPLQPGQKIFIGLISPNLERLLFLDQKKEILIEEKKFLTEEKIAKARKRLQKLETKRNILIGDFYGLNQLGHRYSLIFDRLGYIRYRLTEIEKEMAEIQKKLKDNL